MDVNEELPTRASCTCEASRAGSARPCLSTRRRCVVECRRPGGSSPTGRPRRRRRSAARDAAPGAGFSRCNPRGPSRSPSPSPSPSPRRSTFQIHPPRRRRRWRRRRRRRLKNPRGCRRRRSSPRASRSSPAPPPRPAVRVLPRRRLTFHIPPPRCPGRPDTCICTRRSLLRPPRSPTRRTSPPGRRSARSDERRGGVERRQMELKGRRRGVSGLKARGERRETNAGRESPQGTAFTTRTRSYGNQSARDGTRLGMERHDLDQLPHQRVSRRRVAASRRQRSALVLRDRDRALHERAERFRVERIQGVRGQDDERRDRGGGRRRREDVELRADLCAEGIERARVRDDDGRAGHRRARERAEVEADDDVVEPRARVALDRGGGGGGGGGGGRRRRRRRSP
eukprot:31515-Pelagococcus_subviridis.AAC.1